MSLRNQVDSTAQDFKYGLLASKLCAVLSKAEGTQITPSDRMVIESAEKCVQNHLEGAQALYCGKTVAGLNASSIKSLNLALSPLEKLIGTASLSDQTIIQFLNEIVSSLKEVKNLSTIPPETDQIALTKKFFSLVGDSLLYWINRSRLQRSHSMSL